MRFDYMMINENKQKILRSLERLLAIPAEELKKNFAHFVRENEKTARRETEEAVNDEYHSSRFSRQVKKDIYDNPHIDPYLRKIWKQGFDHCWTEFKSFADTDLETLDLAKKEIVAHRLTMWRIE